jgi:hypothetical protein
VIDIIFKKFDNKYLQLLRNSNNGEIYSEEILEMYKNTIILEHHIKLDYKDFCHWVIMFKLNDKIFQYEYEKINGKIQSWTLFSKYTVKFDNNFTLLPEMVVLEQITKNYTFKEEDNKELK